MNATDILNDAIDHYTTQAEFSETFSYVDGEETKEFKAVFYSDSFDTETGTDQSVLTKLNSLHISNKTYEFLSLFPEGTIITRMKTNETFIIREIPAKSLKGITEIILYEESEELVEVES